MRKCCVCGANITHPDPCVLFYSEKTNSEMCCCLNCEKQMTLLLEGTEPTAIKKAINYFYTYIDEIDDKEVKGYLADIVENNAIAIDELTEKQYKAKPISERQKDYFADGNSGTKESYASGWISGMRFFGWLAYILWVIMALVLGCSVFKYSIAYGLGIIIGFSIVGFVGIAGTMIFIDMAEDIKCIRNQISKKK